MTKLLSPSAKQQFFTDGSTVAAGYLLYTYAANTTDPLATYSNRAGSVANANPIVLDARGEAIIYLTPGLVYDYALKTSAGSTVWTREDVTADAGDADAVAYADPVAPAVLKTLSDIANGEPVSVLRAIDRTKHAGIFAGTDTDDHAASINSILTDMSAAGRGHLIHEGGTIYVGSKLSVPSDVLFTGGGVKSVLKPLAAMTSMVELVGDYAQARDLNLQNVASRASRGITVTSPFFAKVLDCYFGSLPVAVYINGAQKGWVERCHMLNCDFGIFSADDGREFRFIGNHIQGGTGMWVTKDTQQAEGLKIIGNTILPSVTSDPNSGHGIAILAGLEIQMLANMCGNADKNGILLAATGGNAVSCVKIAHGWCDNDTGTVNSEGLYVYGNVSDVFVSDYTFANSNQRGVHIGLTAETAPQRIRLRDLKFLNTGTGDIQLEKGVDIQVSGITFSNATSNIREEDNTVTGRVHECTFSVAPSPKSTGIKHYDNTGAADCNDDHGAYTPTLANVANTSARSALATSWSRTGDTVTVSGRLDATPTASATLTQVSMTLPVASNLALNGDLGGTCSMLGAASIAAGTISGDTTNELAVLSFYSTGTASVPVFFTFSYRVQ